MTLKTFVVLGMPSSGKSTFIAALGFVLMNPTDQSSLRITELSDSEGHLLRLQQRWLTFKKLERTKQADECWITLHVAANDTEEFSVTLPDLSGESLEQAVVSGIFPEELFDVLRECYGVLLFTNTIAKLDDVLLTDVARLLSERPTKTTVLARKRNTLTEHSDTFEKPTEEQAVQNGTAAADGTANADSKSTGEKQFVPLEMPEQAKVVQLLQQISDIDPTIKRKVAVVLSSWDTVNDRYSPESWIKENRTMLSQYLKYSERNWETHVYGVSAQGGDLPKEKARLQMKMTQERVQIIGHEASLHDLSAPLKWLVDGA